MATWTRGSGCSTPGWSGGPPTGRMSRKPDLRQSAGGRGSPLEGGCGVPPGRPSGAAERWSPGSVSQVRLQDLLVRWKAGQLAHRAPPLETDPVRAIGAEGVVSLGPLPEGVSLLEEGGQLGAQRAQRRHRNRRLGASAELAGIGALQGYGGPVTSSGTLRVCGIRLFISGADRGVGSDMHYPVATPQKCRPTSPKSN